MGVRRVLHFGCAYGFRNIQNLVRRIKAGKSEYDFVEIMACPGGMPPSPPVTKHHGWE